MQTAQHACYSEIKKLRKKALKKGVYENFGDKEYHKLKNKYGDIGFVQDFYLWCLNADDNKIAGGY